MRLVTGHVPRADTQFCIVSAPVDFVAENVDSKLV